MKPFYKQDITVLVEVEKELIIENSNSSQFSISGLLIKKE